MPHNAVLQRHTKNNVCFSERDGKNMADEIKNNCECSDEEENAVAEQTEEIIKTGSVTKTKGKHCIHCLTVVGQVEGHYILPPQNKSTKYEHVIPQLVAIEEDPEIEGLMVMLNTVGGDVEAGLAIAELISGMSKPTVSLVLGGGHSIGVPLACSARVSFIVPSATMTIHPVRMNGNGTPMECPPPSTLIADVGTVLDGEAAVREGLIDRLGGLSDAIKCLYSLIEQGKGAK